jgi:hypothetical protein
MYIVREVQYNQKGLKFNYLNQVMLVYTDNINVLEENINTTKKQQQDYSTGQ